MVDLEWKDPPPRQQARFDWKSVAELCRTKPGEWLYTGIHSSASVTHINKGKFVPFRNGKFEATGRKLDDGTFKVWVRFVGENHG